jgi:sodium/potassium/calcium exchanger 2
MIGYRAPYDYTQTNIVTKIKKKTPKRLPLPWLLYAIVFQEPIPVSSKGMVCSITLLFCMLMLVFFSILIFNWKMTKAMGISMFFFYFGFVAVSLSLTYEYIKCPIEFTS